jgi:hypothetical protein
MFMRNIRFFEVFLHHAIWVISVQSFGICSSLTIWTSVNLNQSTYIKQHCCTARGMYDIQVTNRKEGDFLSCSCHIPRLQHFTKKERKSARLNWGPPLPPLGPVKIERGGIRKGMGVEELGGYILQAMWNTQNTTTTSECSSFLIYQLKLHFFDKTL